MASLKRLGARLLPRRASTQTWMFLTFSLFVGMAVVLVALYMAFVLHDDVRSTMRQTVLGQAHRIALRLEQAGGPESRSEVLRSVALLSDLRVTVASADSTVLSAPTAHAAGTLWQQPGMQGLAPDEQRYVHVEESGTGDVFYGIVRRADSGLFVRVGQPEPPLFAMVQRMEVALIVGMLMALLLALLGSWIAAQQVTGPLRAIRDAARSIIDGKFNRSIRVTSRATEFQDVAQSLNRAAASFREKIDELERLTQLQSEFIGNVSHEVKNPIFAVGGYLEALSTPTLDSKLRQRYAEKGLVNLQRLNNLFNDLIEIAQLEYREDLIKPKVFDLEDLLEEIGEMLEPKATGKGLHLELDNPHVLVNADRSRIRQVLINLIDNAISYTDKGTVRCRYRRRRDKVRIEVIDTGKGIPETHLDRIFERFYRVDPDRSRKSGGTGLGLSIVKQIIAAHGEAIHVESTEGRGTRFWFELPYAGRPVAAEADVE